MMPTFAFLDDDGYPTTAGMHPTAIPAGAVPLGHPDDLTRLPALRWQNGRWTLRPVLPAPVINGGDLWFDGLPDAAQITLNDAITGDPVRVPARIAGTVSVTLTKGSWHLRITAPNPWMDYEALIDIDGGSPQRALDALANARRAARARVNERAGQARLALVTDISGQTAIYQAKEAEARAYLAAGAPDDLHDYPAIAAEIGITAPTAYQLAQIWLFMAAQFRMAAAASEHARLSALAAVDAAPSIEALEAILHPADTKQTTQSKGEP
jgi:hypothetical protein